MPWPIATDFVPMLQNPKIGFKDPDLKTCTIEKTNSGQPRPRSGAFAAVYKGTYPNGKGDVAIRVFTTESAERRERYAAISEYLDSLKNRPKSLVGFKYWDEGIKSVRDGKWYPLVTMEWVAGDILFDWLRKQCTGGQAKALSKASDDWVSLVDDLATRDIAHGDLQHANVMVTPQNELKLVDYDCMCVPKLVGRPNLEIGVEPYQHRERDGSTTLFPGLDNFSAAFILVALRALAANPRLWKGYIEPDQGDLYDKILFRKEDFDNPDHSLLIKELKRSPDEKVQKWVDSLHDLWHGPMREVPPLTEFVSDAGAIGAILDAGDFDKALDLIGRLKKIPDDISPRVPDAKESVQSRLALESAVNAGNEDEMQRIFSQKSRWLTMNGYPRAKPAVDIAKVAPQVIPVIKDLTTFRQNRKWRDFVTLWDRHLALLQGRRSAEPFRTDVDHWRARNTACDEVLKLLQRTPYDLPALRTSWKRLCDLQGHPDTDARRTEIDKLLVRGDTLAKFQQIPNILSEANDRALIDAWREDLFAGWNEGERERPRLLAAQQRLAAVEQFRIVIQQATPVTIHGEQTIETASQALPSGYQHSLQPRLDEARRRLTAFSQLDQACKQKPASERALATAWKEAQAVGLSPLVDAPVQTRLNLAIQRVPILDQLARISLKQPPDQLDAVILSAWGNHDALLRGCPDAAPWQAAFDQAIRRAELLDQLRAAAAAADFDGAEALKADPLLVNYPLPPDIDARLEDVGRKYKKVRELTAALDAGRKDQFVKLFNAELVRENAAALHSYQEKIIELVKSEILPVERIGITGPRIGKAVDRPKGARTCKLRWIWPEARITDQCIIKITAGRPNGQSIDQVEGFSTTIDARTWISDGCKVLPVRPNWERAFVVVSAVVDLGFEKLYSAPCVIGRIE